MIADRTKVCDHMKTHFCVQLRLCDHMETKVLRSAIETHPIIFRILSHDSTFVCSIVGTVSVATLISLSSQAEIEHVNVNVSNEEFMELHVMNVFIIATTKILKTRTKRATFGKKSAWGNGGQISQENCSKISSSIYVRHVVCSSAYTRVYI